MSDALAAAPFPENETDQVRVAPFESAKVAGRACELAIRGWLCELSQFNRPTFDKVVDALESGARWRVGVELVDGAMLFAFQIVRGGRLVATKSFSIDLPGAPN